MLIDDWHDYVRVSVVIMGAICLLILPGRFSENAEEYNTKTRDLWFSTVLWSITAIVLAVEGMFEDRGVDPRLVFYTLATILTLKALLKKGSWGKRA